MINRAVVFDAIRFWETGRLGYNGVLAALLLMIASVGDAWEAIAREFGLIVILGAVANVFYCVAYPLDLLMQATPARAAWRHWRWVAWAAGTAFAALLALVVTVGVGGLAAMGVGPPD